LQHFIASPAWDDGPLWTVLAQQADRLVGGADAYLVIDDTTLPKKGTLSVGVARQYCGQLGKRANCQSLVSLTLAQGEVPVPVGLRLFLPDEWAGDVERCARAGVPEAEVAQRSKGAIALAELDRVAAAGVRFGTVLADAGYGASAAFRHGLDHAGTNGRSVSRATRRSMIWMSNSCRQQGVAASRCRTRSRALLRKCWRNGRGGA
jgi:SRSO17 transposase